MNSQAADVYPDEATRGTDGNAWQDALKSAIRDPIELCRLLKLPPRFEASAVRASKSFGVFAPREFVARMRVGDPYDPLLRQILPLADELTPSPGDSVDPVGDLAATPVAGLIRKYQGRALMVATGTCAVHCRYCFRRHYPYSEVPRTLDDWQPALDELAADRSLAEVILSGGDPLTLTDRRLGDLVRRIAEVRHLRRLRIHTRLPIVIPARVCDELLAWLGDTRLVTYFVVHVNHPAEIDQHVARALSRLVDAGITVLNQSVLLAGVNDRLEVLLDLSERLVDLRVLPYYLHQLDRVRGARHFEVPEEVGRRLVDQLRQRLPGYAVPAYVRETAGELAKTPILS